MAGHATPPQFASGMNRLPVITRSNRHSTAHSSTTLAQTAATPVMTGRRDASSIGGKPFDPPAYLSFSTCFDQFVTVPKPRELGPGLEPATATSDTTTGTGLGTGTSTIRNGNRTRQSTNPALRLPSPSPQPSSPIPLPTCWAEHDRCNLLDLDSQALKVRFNGQCFGSGSGPPKKECVGFRSSRYVPLSVARGLLFPTLPLPLTSPPGTSRPDRHSQVWRQGRSGCQS